jgi:hypothetical protein
LLLLWYAAAAAAAVRMLWLLNHLMIASCPRRAHRLEC